MCYPESIHIEYGTSSCLIWSLKTVLDISRPYHSNLALLHLFLSPFRLSISFATFLSRSSRVLLLPFRPFPRQIQTRLPFSSIDTTTSILSSVIQRFFARKRGRSLREDWLLRLLSPQSFPCVDVEMPSLVLFPNQTSLT